MHVRVQAAVRDDLVPLPVGTVGVHPVLGFPEVPVDGFDGPFEFGFCTRNSGFERPGAGEDDERVAVAELRVVHRVPTFEEPVVTAVLGVPLVVREERESVFGRRPAPDGAVEERADTEVVDRARGGDEVFRVAVVDEPVPFVQLGDVAAVAGVDAVGIVEVQDAKYLLAESLWVLVC